MRNIIEDYERFLRKSFGAGKEYRNGEELRPSDLCDAALKALRAGTLCVLDDSEVIDTHRQIKGKDFLSAISTSAKVASLEAILPKISGKDIRSAIEFGGGPGFLPIYLAENGFDWEMALLDGNEEYLEYAKIKSKQHGVKLETVNQLADDSGLASESYDLVYAIDLLDCSPNWRNIVKEMARVAKKQVIIIYGIDSIFRHVNPLDVALELSRSMLIEAPYFFGKMPDGSHDSVMISASKVATEEDRGRIVLATTAMY